MDNAPAPSPAPSPAAAPAALPGVGEVLSAGTGVTLDNAGLLFGLWACTDMPAQVLGLVVRTMTGLGDKDGLKNALANQDYGALGGLAAVGMVGLLTGMLAYAATILLAARAFRGRPVALGELLADGLGRLPALLGASLVTGLAVGLGTLALFLPGLYLLVRLCLAACASCAEERGALDSVGRSWALTSGRLMDVVVFVFALFIVGLVAAVALMAGGFVLRLIGAVAGTAGTALAGLVVNLLQFLVSAWGTACMTRFFLELADRTPSA
ncbi:MAG: hypothetical protein HY079_14275 [Elusimicrobia bacterium]|nr:hypothetical protein [Elusimicrobiota bacterium]